MVCVPACFAGGVFGVLYSLEEVFLAVDAAGAGEAAVGQLHLAVGALEAGAVPVPVQHLQDELVQDVLVAAGALGDFWAGGRWREEQRQPPRRLLRARTLLFLSAPRFPALCHLFAAPGAGTEASSQLASKNKFPKFVPTWTNVSSSPPCSRSTPRAVRARFPPCWGCRLARRLPATGCGSPALERGWSKQGLQAGG